MKRFVTAALALLIVSTAQAASDFKDGQNLYRSNNGQLIGGIAGDVPSDTNSVGLVLRIDPTTGATSMSERFKDRDTFLPGLGPIINDTTSVGQADSTLAPIYTAPYGRLFLHIKVQTAMPTGYLATGLQWARLAIDIEGGFGGTIDTNTFVPWVHADALLASATDSMAYGATAAGTASTMHPGFEIQVTIPITNNAAAAWGNPNGAYLELADTRGVPYWAPYTKVRSRLIATNLAFGTNVAFVKQTIRLIGRPF